MISDELKQAILNRDFDRAQELIAAWGQDIRARMRTAAGSTELRRIHEDATSFGEETLYLAHIIRSQIATELQANSASFLYRDADLKQNRWQIQA